MHLAVTHVGLCIQVWLQEFAWTEADKPIKLQARSIMVPNNPKLARQPIFCFQTMLNLLYWSCFVYDHKKVSQHGSLCQVDAQSAVLEPLYV